MWLGCWEGTVAPTAGNRPAPALLTLHVEGEALPEAVHVVVDDAGQGLLVGFPAGHQAVAADDGHRAVGVPDLLVLRFALQACFPGHHAGRLPIGRGAGGHQHLVVLPLLGSKHCLGTLYPVGGFGCREAEGAMGPALPPRPSCAGPGHPPPPSRPRLSAVLCPTPPSTSPGDCFTSNPRPACSTAGTGFRQPPSSVPWLFVLLKASGSRGSSYRGVCTFCLLPGHPQSPQAGLRPES